MNACNCVAVLACVPLKKQNERTNILDPVLVLPMHQNRTASTDRAVTPATPQAMSSLVGLAILKVEWELRGRDYLDAFVPMVVECIRLGADDVVSLPALRDSIMSRFGMPMPLNPLKTVLVRAARQGFLTRDRGTYRRDRQRCAATTFADREAKVLSNLEAVCTLLVGYAEKQHATTWTSEEAEAALLAFLATNDWQTLMSGLDRNLSVTAPQESNVDRYIVSSFIYEARAISPTVVDGIETLAKGNMLANALFMPTLERINQRFRNTRVYFDTTFLVFALGYGGPDREASGAELLTLLHESGAELRCFESTVNEIRGIFDACANRIRYGKFRDAYGPTIDYFVEKGYSAGDIDLIGARLDEKLAFHRIKVEPLPDYEREMRERQGPSGSVVKESVFTNPVDELQLEAHLKQEIRYHNPAALRHDVDCIAAIARLRGGKAYFEIETCRAIFVSTNSGLAWAAKSFFPSTEDDRTKVPPCLTDHALGNLLWLKNPTIAPDLPRKMLIADAYAATQPPAELWKSYLAEIYRLKERGTVPSHDYALLRYAASAKRAVMDITKGDEAAFSEGTVGEVLAIAREQVRADLDAELRKTRDELVDRDRLLEETRSAGLENLQRVSEEQAAVAQALENALEREREREERTVLKARLISARLMLIPRTACFLALLIATTLTFPWSLPSITAGSFRYFGAALLAALFVLSIWSMYYGGAITTVLSRLEDRLAKWIASLLR